VTRRDVTHTATTTDTNVKSWIAIYSGSLREEACGEQKSPRKQGALSASS
jgi:hypothetical protein